MRRKGFTLIELLVVIAIIAMLLAILMPALSKVKKIAQRVVCGTNLKGLGTAQTVYANDYEDRYAVAQYTMGRGLFATGEGRTTQWLEPTPDWTTGVLSIGASLYLLVREADVSPKSFVCPSSAETVFDGKNSYNNDITELWDFGHIGQGSGPAACQSYAYHFPYSSRAADGSRGAAFAMMADKNPYMDSKLPFKGDDAFATNPQEALDASWALQPDWRDGDVPNQRYANQGANSQPHGKEGQNVVFGDGHSSFEKRPDVGVTHDNIYTRWPSSTPGPTQRRKGFAPPKMPGTFADLTPGGQNDSFLVNDSRRDQSDQ